LDDETIRGCASVPARAIRQSCDIRSASSARESLVVGMPPITMRSSDIDQSPVGGAGVAGGSWVRQGRARSNASHGSAGRDVAGTGSLRPARRPTPAVGAAPRAPGAATASGTSQIMLKAKSCVAWGGHGGPRVRGACAWRGSARADRANCAPADATGPIIASE
jgi:hypothetical protein